MTDLDNFIKEYEMATNSHDFNNCAKLITDDAIYWFSDGSFTGLEHIRKAFESTWETIEDETYTIDNLKWITQKEEIAVCVYKFSWKGTINGKSRQGKGRGTNILIKRNEAWKIIHEHLSSANK